MQRGRSITHVNDSVLVDHIQAANRRVLFMAPGVSKAVADALAEAGQKMGHEAVDVIVDMDPEVYRLGYGTVEGLAAIDHAAQGGALRLCSQPGVRLGVLIADDTTVVYAPTPELIESSTEEPSQPNAIVLEAPPAALASDVGLGAQPTRERTVGLDAVQPTQLSSVRSILAENPPLRFDLARKVRIYSNFLQFVELSLVNCFVSRHKAAIPSHLVGLAGNTELESRFRAQFDMADKTAFKVKSEDGKREITEQTLQQARTSIARRFLIPVTGFGIVIVKDRRQEFQKAVDALSSDVAAFERGVVAEFENTVARTSEALVEALLPAVLRNPPDLYLKFLGKPDETQIKSYLAEDIRGALSRVAPTQGKMEVKVLFKDITYEMIQDTGFLEAAKKAGLDLASLHHEADAVQGQLQPELGFTEKSSTSS